VERSPPDVKSKESKSYYRASKSRIPAYGVAPDINLPSKSALASDPKRDSNRVAAIPHDLYDRVPDTLVIQLGDRLCEREDRMPTTAPAGDVGGASAVHEPSTWERNSYNDEIVQITVDYLTLGAKVMRSGARQTM
jgi:hypothetical protein